MRLTELGRGLDVLANRDRWRVGAIHCRRATFLIFPAGVRGNDST